jgi:phage shock protein A
MVSSAGRTASANAGAIGYTSRLDEYKEAIGRLFPLLPKDTVDAWSISEADILSLGLLLECYPQEVEVLEIGTFVGTSAFFFASHPKVTRVISVDPNPTVAEELNDKSEMLGAQLDPESLGDLRVLDVARAVLAEFPDENRKVQLHAGTVGNGRIAITEDSSRGVESSEAPMSELAGEGPLVAFVDGLHTREGVHADLKAIFDYNPHAVAILDDCRHAWGPFVQAGVVSFMEEAEEEYDLQLVGDLGAGVATSNVGIVYPRADAAEVQKILADFVELFTERLDPLRLLRREEELIAIVNRYKNAANEAARLLERNARLEEDNAEQRERNSELTERNSELTERNSELAERNFELAERNSGLVERHANLAATLKASLNMEKAKHDDRISQFRERIGQLKDRGSGLEERISRLEEQISRLEKRNLELRKENSQLVGENSQLVVYRSGRRYRVADAVAESLRWVPSAARRARRRPGPE